MTPPYKCPTRWSPGSRSPATARRPTARSTRSIGGPGGEPRTLDDGGLGAARASGAAARRLRPRRGRCRARGRGRSTQRSLALRRTRRFRLKGGKECTETLISPGGDDPDAASSPNSMASPPGSCSERFAAAIGVGALLRWVLGASGICLLIGAGGRHPARHLSSSISSTPTARARREACACSRRRGREPSGSRPPVAGADGRRAGAPGVRSRRLAAGGLAARGSSGFAAQIFALRSGASRMATRITSPPQECAASARPLVGSSSAFR